MSYPTTVLYNNSQSNHFHGVRDADGITEFVEDMLRPAGEYIFIILSGIWAKICKC